MNNVIISGKIASDLEVKTTNKGLAYLKFRLLTKKTSSEQNNLFDSIPCVAWGKIVDKFKEVSKNDYLIISGKISSNDYKTKDGRQINAAEIVVIDIEKINTSDDNSSIKNTGAI